MNKAQCCRSVIQLQMNQALWCRSVIQQAWCCRSPGPVVQVCSPAANEPGLVLQVYNQLLGKLIQEDFKCKSWLYC